MRVIHIFGFLIIGFCLLCPACSKQDEKKSVPAQKSASPAAGTIQKISDNPEFFTAKDLAPQAPNAKELDGLIRPALRKLFEDAKLVSETGPQPPRMDGEVEENKLVYVVRRLADAKDGDALHAALREQEGFSSSPRLGAKPVHARTQVGMSLAKSTGRRGYSLVITVNLSRQRIEVISYKLGSKYDRLS